MSGISRRRLLTAAASAGALGALSACSANDWSVGSTGDGDGGSRSKPPKPIGDGSTADTGAQPKQPKAQRLKPGERPPQFVVFSWDGAGELSNKLFSRFRKVAADHGASMTFFLSGIYTLPESKKDLYRPPQHPVGASAIGYLSDRHIHATLQQIRAAWLEGHEIGTHFNGHFCGTDGVRLWSPAEWRSEIEQAIGFVTRWRTNTGFTDLEPLPFDYRKELIGGRAPCLEGQANLLPTVADLGWKYDASSPGGLQIWPGKVQGGRVWDLPLQSIPFPGHSFQVLSMDYNLMANQSNANPLGDRSRFDAWRAQARDSYLAGFRRAYEGNRAPLFIGNHFERWNGGIYMDAVEQAIARIAEHDEVRMVSFRQLVEWLEVQDPAVLRKLRTLSPGQSPLGGWAEFLGTASRSGTPSS
ncbi:polysaccharide deacetylase family protein [Streptomyces siamensis]|uniref:Secreted protein n=1 Tax=Streptomyces siamensis TaxID=1274986 RepID=A0ABP9JHA2_9ACTN